tara:strand:+ start:1717 stop:2892 length:1176 start_codon:yes stop_codon:yes gene_type:complete
MATDNQNVTQTTTQTIKEDPKFAAYRQALLDETVGLVQSRAQQPVLPPAYYVAGLSPQEEQATALGQAGIGSYLPYLQSSQGILGEGARTLGQARGTLSRGERAFDIMDPAEAQLQAGYEQLLPASGATPELQSGIASIRQAQQAQFDPSSASQFQSPYQQYVEGAINRQFDQAQNRQDAQAVSSGAFSGSRRDIMDAELEGQRARAVGEAYAQDFGRSSQQAQQAFQEEQNRRLTAGQGLSNIGFQRSGALQDSALARANLAQGQLGLASNLAGGIAGLGQQITGLSGLQAGLGQQAQAQNVQDISTLLNLGTLQRGLAQSTLDSQRQRELDIQRYPYQQLQFLSDIYKGVPSTQQTITQTPTYSPSPFQQAAGLGIAGIAATSGGRSPF